MLPVLDNVNYFEEKKYIFYFKIMLLNSLLLNRYSSNTFSKSRTFSLPYVIFYMNDMSPFNQQCLCQQRGLNKGDICTSI